MNTKRLASQRGFTLIELITVVAIIGILAALAVTSFTLYKSDAAYAVVQSTVNFARNSLYASLLDAENPPAAVPLTSQTSAGPLQDTGARNLLPTLNLPPSLKFQVSHDPTCTTGSCTADYIQVNHCLGQEYSVFMRRGDGTDMLMENVLGAGCS